MAEEPEASGLYCRLRRLNFTPMRDLIRGRITGRFDFYSQLRAVFPVPLAKHLLMIVRRTGLDLSEQVRVTQELIQRFGGRGHERRPWDRVQARLDKRRTAGSIRRRYKRQRHWVRRTFDKSLAALAYSPLVLIGLYLCAVVFFWFSKPTISVDYLAQLNAPALAVPEEDRAWPVYREAIMKMQLRHVEIQPDPESYGMSPYHPLWDQRVMEILKHGDTLTLIRDAASKPGMGLTVGYYGHHQDEDARAIYGSLEIISGSPLDIETGEPFETRQPLATGLRVDHVGPMWRLTMLVSADAYLAIKESDPDRFCDDIEAMVGIARHMGELPFMMCHIARVGVQTATLDLLTDALVDDGDLFTDAHLDRLSECIGSLDTDLVQTSSSDRAFVMDFIQRMYTDNGRGGGHLTHDGVWLMLYAFRWEDEQAKPFLEGLLVFAITPGMAALKPSREQMSETFGLMLDAYERESHIPMWQQQSSEAIEIMSEWSGWDLFRYHPLTGVMYGNIGLRRSSAIRDARYAGVLVGIALEQYRRDHGSYPDSLESLQPDYLLETPCDPITGGPLLYKLVESQPLVYSVGGDGDDDGGRLPVSRDYWEGTDYENVNAAETWNQRSAGDGDWVLYPYPETSRITGPKTMLPDELEAYFAEHAGMMGNSVYGWRYPSEDDDSSEVEGGAESPGP